MAYNMRIVNAHISNIRAGDTVVHDGHMKTVGERDIKYDSFMGRTLFGDSHGLGTILIQKVLWK